MFQLKYELSSLPPLHRAAGQGDLAELARLLDEGAEVDARADTFMAPYDATKRGLTPLMVAAGSERGTAETVRALLEHGARTHAVSDAGVGALWYAAGAGDPERVAALLEDSDPHAIAVDGRSVVAMAARAGSAEALRLLLREGASPSPSSGLVGYAEVWGEAVPLFAAATAGSAECVRMLLEIGVPPAAQDSAGQTALMHASTPEVVALLIAAGCPPNARDANGQNALHLALQNRQVAMLAAMRDAPDVSDMRKLEPDIRRRQVALVAALLDAGVDSEVRDAHGRSVLISYCLRHDLDRALVELLLARGADVYGRDSEGWTALHTAAWNHNYQQSIGDVIRLLVGAGVPVDARDQRGRTPLHLAVGKERGDRSVIGVLLDLGADIEARDADGLTPLFHATGVAHHGHEIVRLLLARGAALDARTPDRRTARDIAAAHIASYEQHVTAPTRAPKDPAVAAAEAASHRLTFRSARMTLAVLDAATGRATLLADVAPELPEPLWLGYRLESRRPPLTHWIQSLETSHIVEICSYGHASWTGEVNAAACFPSEEAAAEGLLIEEEGAPTDVYVYRAIPLLFDISGVPRPVTVEDLLGSAVPTPQAPDSGRFTRLGYDVTECRLSAWSWTGCSPLSPYCNGMAFGFSALVNRHALVDDLAAAYDLAVLFGVTQPEPGPYIIVEVWRRAAGV